MQLTNYYDHPEHQMYVVFQFYLAEHADEFERMLVEEKIAFERHFDSEGRQSRHLFGIHKRHNTRAMYCNNMLHAKHRKKFISNPWLRYTVLIITFALVALGVAGYILSH